MVAAWEKTPAHTRSRDQRMAIFSLRRVPLASEKIWVRDVAEVKINVKQNGGKSGGSVQGKKKEEKKTSFACKSF